MKEIELIQELTDEMGKLIGQFIGKDIPVFAIIAIMEYHKFNLMKAITAKPAPTEEPLVKP